MLNRGTMCLIALSTFLREFVDDRREQLQHRDDRGSQVLEYALIAGGAVAIAVIVVAAVKRGALAGVKSIPTK